MTWDKVKCFIIFLCGDLGPQLGTESRNELQCHKANNTISFHKRLCNFEPSLPMASFCSEIPFQFTYVRSCTAESQYQFHFHKSVVRYDLVL